ncbi:hypothetical protein PBRA_009444, partial [Plasmodiophora brassicae]
VLVARRLAPVSGGVVERQEGGCRPSALRRQTPHYNAVRQAMQASLNGRKRPGPAARSSSPTVSGYALNLFAHPPWLRSGTRSSLRRHPPSVGQRTRRENAHGTGYVLHGPVSLRRSPFLEHHVPLRFTYVVDPVVVVVHQLRPERVALVTTALLADRCDLVRQATRRAAWADVVTITILVHTLARVQRTSSKEAWRRCRSLCTRSRADPPSWHARDASC